LKLITTNTSDMFIELFLTSVAVWILTDIVVATIAWLTHGLSVKRIRKNSSQWLKEIPLTENDQELIRKNQELMKKVFGDEKIEQKMKRMSKEDRVKLIVQLIEGAVDNYDVKIDRVNFLHSDEIGDGVCGFYDPETCSISINLDYIICDDDVMLHHIVGTVFHELRHAQQFRSITDPDYNVCSEEQREAWALNFAPGHYISCEVDFKTYREQTVERDARAVGMASIQGF